MCDEGDAIIPVLLCRVLQPQPLSLAEGVDNAGVVAMDEPGAAADAAAPRWAPFAPLFYDCMYMLKYAAKPTADGTPWCMRSTTMATCL